jgi:hypothetical protein
MIGFPAFAAFALSVLNLLIDSPAVDTPSVDMDRVVMGEIDAEFAARFEHLAAQHAPITIGSTGGNGRLALGIAETIRKRGLPIQIAGGCVSACSEIIMAAASRHSKLTLLDAPLLGAPVIGVHHNPEMVRRVFERIGRRDFGRCFGDLHRDFVRLRGEGPRLSRLWRKQEHHLQMDHSRTSKSAPCADVRVHHANREWYPTSRQLREEFGYRFSGGVCADSLKCMAEALSSTQRVGSTFVIGDTRYRLDQPPGGKKQLTPIPF